MKSPISFSMIGLALIFPFGAWFWAAAVQYWWSSYFTLSNNIALTHGIAAALDLLAMMWIIVQHGTIYHAQNKKKPCCPLCIGRITGLLAALGILAFMVSVLTAIFGDYWVPSLVIMGVGFFLCVILLFFGRGIYLVVPRKHEGVHDYAVGSNVAHLPSSKV